MISFLTILVINGTLKALLCPPFNKFYELPRQESIKALVKKYKLTL